MTITNISFPFTKDSESLPAQAVDADVVGQNIQRILLTRRGSRVMRPDIGSVIQDFVFENTGVLLRSRIATEVRRAVANGEPRATILDVQTLERENASGGIEVVVEVTFEVNRQVGITSMSFQRSSGG